MTPKQADIEPSDSPHGLEMVSVTREVWQECLRRAQEAESLGRELEQVKQQLSEANARREQTTAALKSVQSQFKATREAQSLQQAPRIVRQPQVTLSPMSGWINALRRL
jgi:hypothetical protein